MTNPFEFSVDLGKPTSDRRRAPQDPLRILVLTDLGDMCQSRKSTTLGNRPMRPLDIDALETLLENEQPSLSIAGGVFAPKEIDDFRPDAICRALPEFQRLKDIRMRLKNTATFDAAAQEVRDLLNVGASTEPDVPKSESDTDTMSRLFGGLTESNATPETPAPTGGFLGNLLHDAVAEHIVAIPNPGTEHYVNAVDAAAAAQLRAVLHDPQFQALEAAWRGLDMLASNIETDEDLSVHVWNVDRSEMLDATGSEGASVGDSALHKRIVADRQDRPFSVIVTDIRFSSDADDVRLLATLGAMAGRTGAVLLTQVAPELVGAQSWQAIANAPEEISEPSADWTALQESGIGAHIAAFAPRFIMRTPYGKRRDPADVFFPFEEVDAPGNDPSCFLWGAPTLIAATLIAQSFSEDGWNARLSTAQSYGDLPWVTFDSGSGTGMKPCTEAQFSNRVAEALLHRGVVPLIARQDQNVVTLPWMQAMSAGGDRFGPFNT